MQLQILAIGKNMPAWINAGFQEYAKRLPKGFVSLHELPAAKFSAQHTAEQLKEDEGARLLKAVPVKRRIIALEIEGQAWSTPELAQQLSNWQQRGQDLSFIIGGPEGLSQDLLNRADEQWSLSALTLPHPLVRIILMEQLYRAWSLLQNHPYHR